ncbi:MAG: SGNH/GDSL hydrolase family protein [Methylophilus sp.]
MGRYYILILLTFSCLICVAKSSDTTPQPMQGKAIRIINIGDSITQGGLIGREEYTYRLPLYRSLKKHHIPADFIGTRRTGVSSEFKWPVDFDLDHEGFYGATTAEVSKQLKNDIEKLTAPDIAIIDLGSNDEHSDITKNVIVPLTEIIRELRLKNPNIKIILVQIPGFWENLILHYKIWLLSFKLSTTNSPIVTVPIYLVWHNQKDTFDGDHPNISGQNKMAQLLYPKLISLLSTNHH